MSGEPADFTSPHSEARSGSPEFEAFRQEFYASLLPEDMPEDERQLWLGLR
jgi:hypothetical protein